MKCPICLGERYVETDDVPHQEGITQRYYIECEHCNGYGEVD